MTKAFADMTEKQRAECRGMWCDVETPVGTERAIYDQSRWTQEPTLFEPGYGHFEADFSKVTPRYDLPRAWNSDGTHVKGSWTEAEYIGDSHGMNDVYYFDGTPTHRHFETEWEEIPNE